MVSHSPRSGRALFATSMARSTWPPRPDDPRIPRAPVDHAADPSSILRTAAGPSGGRSSPAPHQPCGRRAPASAWPTNAGSGLSRASDHDVAQSDLRRAQVTTKLGPILADIGQIATMVCTSAQLSVAIEPRLVVSCAGRKSVASRALRAHGGGLCDDRSMTSRTHNPGRWEVDSLAMTI